MSADTENRGEEGSFPFLPIAAASLVLLGSLGILFYWLMFPTNADEARLADRITGVIASAAAAIVGCLLLLLHEFRKVG